MVSGAELPGEELPDDPDEGLSGERYVPLEPVSDGSRVAGAASDGVARE